jgi:acetyl-CoA C-acetyltransferase
VSYNRSPAMAAAIDTALRQAEVGADDVDVFDLYSCFPCVPKLAARHLKLRPDTPLTATGGLTAFGGPGNNYSTHSIVAVVGKIRAGANVGLVYGNGELLTKHHVTLLGREAHRQTYVGTPDPVTPPLEAPPSISEAAAGDATVETYTVEYDRAGEAARGFVIGRLDDGSRFVANTADGDTASLAVLVDPEREAIGRRGVVAIGDDGRNLIRVSR